MGGAALSACAHGPPGVNIAVEGSCLEVGQLSYYYYFFLLSRVPRFPNAGPRTMSTEELSEPVSRSELTALIDAAVARALSSRAREPEGDGELYLSSLFLVVVGVRGDSDICMG